MSGTSLPASLSALFLKKNIYLIILCYLTKFHCLVALYSWDVAQYVYCNCSLTKLWRHKFRNQPYLSNQAVFSIWPKCQDKSLNILRTKRALTWRKNLFFSAFLKQIKQIFLEGDFVRLWLFELGSSPDFTSNIKRIN